MNKEETLFSKRLSDLAVRADRKNIVLYSDFLNLNELNIFHSCAKDLSFIKTRTFGGYEMAERQIIAFIPDALFCEPGNDDYPIRVLRIEPSSKKYAEELTHRDYLGTILGLGIERSTIGDILCDKKGAFVFCLDKIADYILSELVRIKHTSVLVHEVALEEIHYEPEFELIKGSVASVRLDTLLALAFSSSRSSLGGLIEGGSVFVNGKLITSNGYKVKEQDIISVRGHGRFRYRGIVSQTRKGRVLVEVEKYV
ncbi:MAG: RNA-binding protein [Muricoprocola sp.]